MCIRDSVTTGSTNSETVSVTVTTNTIHTATSVTTASATKPTATAAPASVLYGDINLDGKIELADAVLLNKATADVIVLNDTARTNADCVADGEVNGRDAIALLQFLVQIVDTLPLQA